MATERQRPEPDDPLDWLRAPSPPDWRERARLIWQAAGPPQLSVVVASVAVVTVMAIGLAWLLWPRSAAPAAPLALPPLPTTSNVASGATDGGGGPDGGGAPEELVVHAAGAVARPGVYRLPRSARVADLVDAAGGLAPDADVNRLNLAAGLEDGIRLYVPRLGEATPPEVAGSGGDTPARSGEGEPDETVDGASPSPLIDINDATTSELEELPGVGPATAQAIVDHREANGPFQHVDELLEVRGIGPAKLEQLRDLVRV